MGGGEGDGCEGRGTRVVGICILWWHNFEHYRDFLAFENNASIIGPIPKHYRANFTSVLKFQPMVQYNNR